MLCRDSLLLSLPIHDTSNFYLLSELKIVLLCFHELLNPKNAVTLLCVFLADARKTPKVPQNASLEVENSVALPTQQRTETHPTQSSRQHPHA
jgi:hypothetical protein